MKRKTTIISTGIAVVALGMVAALWANRGPRTPTYETTTVERRELVQEVSATGKVKASSDVELGFERGGRIGAVLVTVGQTVEAGAELVRLQNAELAAQLRQARANVDSAAAQVSQYQASLDAAQAKLNELRRGSRQEDIQVKQAELASAKQDLANEFDDVADTLSDVRAKVGDAVNSKVDALYDSDAGIAPQLTFTVATLQAEIDAEQARFTAGQSLQRISQLASGLGIDEASREQALASAKLELTSLRSAFEKMSFAVTTAVNLPSTTLTTYQSNVATAISNINTAATSISALEQSIAAHRTIVQNVTKELDRLFAGTPPEQISAQEATVRAARATLDSGLALLRQAQANVAAVDAQLGGTILKAPFAGIVTRQDAQAGEIVSANVAVVALISVGRFDIEAFIPEVDVAQVAPGQPAKITLDAYSATDEFVASVLSVDPAETIVDGVATYKTTLQFNVPDERIKSGMTANIDIRVAHKESALAVLARAVQTREGKPSVRRLVNGAPQEVSVTLGIRASDGYIEILEGLQEGDVIVLGEK